MGKVCVGCFTIGNARATVWANGEGRDPFDVTVELDRVVPLADSGLESRSVFVLNDLPDMERVTLRAQLWVAETGYVLLDGRNEKGLTRKPRETSPK